jgi:hypothetical protein
MLRSIKELHGYAIHAQDADIGKVHDFLFHGDSWVIRYLVVDTGRWLPGRKVLLATPALGKPNWEHSTFPVALTREQVEKAPDIDTAQPLSREQEAALHAYYGWPVYWNDPASGAWPGLAPYIPLPVLQTPPPPETARAEPRLRSARELTGALVRALEDDAGHVGDLIVDDAPWLIRYAVVHTGKVLPGKRVAVATAWIKSVDMAQSILVLDLPRAAVLSSPPFDPAAGVTRDYEQRLYNHYGRTPYWGGAHDTAQAA